ncbi:MAG: flagellar biosynthesis protein FliS [Rickettsiales bacterium]|nr:flagellar biosynthesis protein FliS [Rickettsiales bacterium]
MAVHFNKAKHQYQKTDISSSQNNDPVEIVKTMVNELRKSMKIVSLHTKDKNNRISRNKHFSKALVIIYTLQTSLDFERGGEIATQLFQVYEYCRQQLIKGFRSQVVEGINKAINALKEIFENTYIQKQNV